MSDCTPPERVKTLAGAFRKAAETPQWKAFLEQWHMRADSFMGPEQFGPWIGEQAGVLERMVKEFGLKK